jgi:hypothetical protein
MPCHCCRRRGASDCTCASAFCTRCGVCSAHCVCLYADLVGEDEDTAIEPADGPGLAEGPGLLLPDRLGP